MTPFTLWSFFWAFVQANPTMAAAWAGCLLVLILIRFPGLLTVLWRRGGAQRAWSARWASAQEVRRLAHAVAPTDGILLGRHGRSWIAVQPLPKRRELGNALIVAPTRLGKGRLAKAQLMTWGGSVIVNDLKGELYRGTAGYRATLGPVFMLDPMGGVGHQLDPLAGRRSEDALYTAAASLMWRADEKDSIFTERATEQLSVLFEAAVLESQPVLSYVRRCVRAGLIGTVEKLSKIDRELAVRFLDRDADDDGWQTDRFLASSWGTLHARLRPVLGENIVRAFAGASFKPADLYGPRPVSVYLRWPDEEALKALAPLVRLVWTGLLGELIRYYDQVDGKDCLPILALVDEAGTAPVPSLAGYASTVAGRGIALWIAVQSIAQLEAEYGKARAQTIRDNCENQMYYRPNDAQGAEHISEQLGQVTTLARSSTVGADGRHTAGEAERSAPLMPAAQIRQFRDEEIVVMHRHYPPMRLERGDWLADKLLVARHGRTPPVVPPLPELARPVATAVAVENAPATESEGEAVNGYDRI